MITEEYLLATGWHKEVFFYEIGGGEDENDCDIFVKGEWALTNDWGFDTWYLAERDELTYERGFPYKKPVMEIIDLP